MTARAVNNRPIDEGHGVKGAGTVEFRYPGFGDEMIYEHVDDCVARGMPVAVGAHAVVARTRKNLSPDMRVIHSQGTRMNGPR